MVEGESCRRSSSFRQAMTCGRVTARMPATSMPAAEEIEEESGRK